MSPSVISSSSGHKFKQPKKAELKPSKELEIFAERTKRVTAAFAKIHLEYDPLDYPTKYQLTQEKVSLHLQENEDEECISRRLLGITRVKLPVPNLFEDAEGNIDISVKSALIYKVQVDILKPEAVKVGIMNDTIHSCLFTIGRYEAPLPRYTFGSKGEITNSRVVGQTRRYYVKDSPQNIKKILKRLGQPYRIHPYTVATASYSGSSYYHNDRVYSVFDYEDWVNSDIELLIKANESGFLQEGKKGMMALFEQFTKKQEQKRKQGENLTATKFLKDIDKEE